MGVQVSNGRWKATQQYSSRESSSASLRKEEHLRMGNRISRWVLFVCLIATMDCYLTAAPTRSSAAFSFEENFDITGAKENFKTSPDGQVWYLFLDKEKGCGFQTKQRYRFGWFSMKLKLVGGDSAGVVTAYYMCSDLDAGEKRDELDFEFLGNRVVSRTRSKQMCTWEEWEAGR
ncbi:hypothetical protein HPP92_010086 [Vanilla planifolia]|uniref:GH16 domain-containing protein n=1 Tax=Vanilla planifolia TaxID=51239 RepID=A0A835UZC7_VANPL|nr:hypothetical protein HPP92_010086 [Vanilla planifolia]